MTRDVEREFKRAPDDEEPNVFVEPKDWPASFKDWLQMIGILIVFCAISLAVKIWIFDPRGDCEERARKRGATDGEVWGQCLPPPGL